MRSSTTNGDNVVIAARSDDYGSALAGLVGENLEALNATVANTIQYTDETTFASEADDIVGANPSAVVIISFREAATLLGLLVDQGLDPATFYGADGGSWSVACSGGRRRFGDRWHEGDWRLG